MSGNADLLARIESISAEGLDPLHTRQALVLKMRAIYKLAASADTEPTKTQSTDCIDNEESEPE
jgi:hypothetical protein